ncbi:hypothetical protein D5086_007913 [Populus alba]|uniref:Uncharacterized protein n=1 Tax=Populus alba TaxID=43335 RepID=A0ACC4CEM3_POPAL
MSIAFIKDLNEPIEIKISEWNTGGLLARIEGLRAFLPKAELMNRVNNFKELKENVKCNTLEFLARALPALSSEPSTPASIGSQEVQRPPRNAASPSSQQRSNGISGGVELASGLRISKVIRLNLKLKSGPVASFFGFVDFFGLKIRLF